MPTIVSRRAPRSVALSSRQVRVLANRMLGELGLSAEELSVLLTDDTNIRELNRRYRKQDRPTDVLAFPLEEHSSHSSRSHPPPLLGDIVISLDTAKRQARQHRRGLIAEVRWLLAHGLLHLVGYDHVTSEQRRRMDAKTRSLVRSAEKPISRQKNPSEP